MAKAEHVPSIITMIIEFLVVPSADLWGIELFSWDIPSTSKNEILSAIYLQMNYYPRSWYSQTFCILADLALISIIGFINYFTHVIVFLLTVTESRPEQCPVPQVELGKHNVIMVWTICGTDVHCICFIFIFISLFIYLLLLFFCVNSVIGDLVEVTDYLLGLDQAAIHSLGLTLGLYYPHLNKMETSKRFRDDVIAAWLQKEDQVLKMGIPTWETLVRALRHPRVNQAGIANKIEADKKC